MISRTTTFAPAPQILQCLACPKCFTKLDEHEDSLFCSSCSTSYPVFGDIPDLRPQVDNGNVGMDDWSEHWSDDNQSSLAQKFFSFYRKAVFARTVQYFTDRYFGPTGVFVEAGSGTAETSARINKGGGDRTLVALDIVRQVLESCDPIMDVRIAADIWHIPFVSGSVDGIWNVGVMEHLTHEQIDEVMAQFHRVLKPGGVLIMLWPGSDSLPQKGLRVVEFFINMKKRDRRFRFHPEEISQIQSMKQARHILDRNGFEVLNVDYGFRSLMAFKTLVGIKR